MGGAGGVTRGCSLGVEGREVGGRARRGAKERRRRSAGPAYRAYCKLFRVGGFVRGRTNAVHGRCGLLVSLGTGRSLRLSMGGLARASAGRGITEGVGRAGVAGRGMAG